jgi:Raf kinase inhibitor-like YbhB/YbcL family protein
MRRHAPKLALLGLALLGALGLSLVAQRKRATKRKEVAMSDSFQLSSPAFDSGERIPVRYTCQGENVSPPLDLSGIPANAQSLAIILHDPDAPHGDYLHWAMWDIHPNITNIPEDAVPIGAVTGTNDFGDEGYGGPCPPSGTHRYEFDLYALDTPLGLAAGSDRAKVMKAIDSHTLAQTQLVGSFGASS